MNNRFDIKKTFMVSGNNDIFRNRICTKNIILVLGNIMNRNYFFRFLMNNSFDMNKTFMVSGNNDIFRNKICKQRSFLGKILKIPKYICLFYQIFKELDKQKDYDMKENFFFRFQHDKQNDYDRTEMFDQGTNIFRFVGIMGPHMKNE